MGENVFLTSEGARQFSDALNLLNASIEEFNKVADKMVPEKLFTDGLINCLADIFRSLELETKVTFKLLFPPDKIEMNDDLVTTIFRSIRTLVFMFIKNSNPSFIRVKVEKVGTAIKTVINDDGTLQIFNQPGYLVRRDLEKVSALLKLHNSQISIRTLQPFGNELVFDINM
jgi:signal transduction histidine kinase